MNALAVVHQLPLEKRLSVMGGLWAELSQAAAGLPVPQWQQDVLDERETQAAAGTATYIDWEVAKLEIREAVQ